MELTENWKEISGFFAPPPLFFFDPVPHQDYSQGGFNLQRGLMLLWVLLLMTFNKKQ